MESEHDTPSLPLPPPSHIDNDCSACNCSRCPSPFLAWQRSVKRRVDHMEEESQGGHVQAYPAAPAVDMQARVEIGHECFALREAMSKKQATINELQLELEEERNASSTAANEAMSMILRLQKEKAEVQMEARQFKRFADEKMAHDQQEILALEDAFFKRGQAVQALSFEVQAYRHHLMSYGVDPDSSNHERVEEGVELNDCDNDSNNISNDDETTITHNNNDATVFNNNYECITPVNDYPACEYPPLKCNVCDIDMNDEFIDLDKYAHTPLTPRRNNTHEHLQHIEQCIYRMERTSSSGNLNVLEKGTLVGNSPRQPRHARRFSTDSAGSFLGRDYVQDRGSKLKRFDECPSMIDRDMDSRDDMSDRVYTIDTVFGAPQPAPTAAVYNDYTGTPRHSIFRGSFGVEEPDIKKLYMRLQALETDRESLKQEIISMRTDKAQLVLLREIAQNLCKGNTQPSLVPEKRLAKKSSLLRCLSFVPVFKWIASLIFWRRKAHQSKYAFGLSNDDVGLLSLLDKSPRARRLWRCSTKSRSRS